MGDMAKAIGQRIRNYRIHAELTQEQLAERAGLHQTYIGQVERGEKNSTIESIHKISAALQIPLSRLFDKLDTQKNTGSDIPLLCYELMAAKDRTEQERIYKILLEIDRYKND